MNNKEKNILDKFLDGYESYSNNNVRYKKIYVKPKKSKCIVGFGFSCILLVILLFMFVFDLLYFVIFIGVLLNALYYGINLFTEKGIGMPKRVPVTDDIDDKIE